MLFPQYISNINRTVNAQNKAFQNNYFVNDKTRKWDTNNDLSICSYNLHSYLLHKPFALVSLLRIRQTRSASSSYDHTPTLASFGRMTSSAGSRQFLQKAHFLAVFMLAVLSLIFSSFLLQYYKTYNS